MKKGVLILLCVVLFLAVVGGGMAYLLFTPRGSLRQDTPDAVMAQTLGDMDRDALRREYVRLCPAPVSEFEDAGTVAGHLFDTAAQGTFTFRPVPDTDGSASQDYILSCGETDLLTAHLRYAEGSWSADFDRLDSLRGATRTLEITVPEDTELTLNGKAVGESYVSRRDVVYPDMTELELRFDAVPHLVSYRVEGIYEPVTLEARREGGLTELYSDGTRWEFTVPDAGGYAFCVTAPGEASVTAGGAGLTDSELVAVTPYATRLDIPGELQDLLPSCRVYAAGGLYTQPEITAVMPDGTPLIPETAADGTVSFPLPGSEGLYEDCHGRVEEFLRALCEYGAGHTQYGPGGYAVAGTDFARYMQNAVASLYWTRGVSVRYDEISSRDYIPVGDSAFICRGHVACTTTTRYEVQDLDMHFEMLWVNLGGGWLIRDLAFTH